MGDYTTSMVKTSLLKRGKGSNDRTFIIVRKAYGVVVLAAVVLQLFRFEELQAFVGEYLAIGNFAAYTLCAVSVIAGVLALPLLMGMQTRHLVRTISIVANYVLLVQWLSLPLWFIK